MLIYLSGEHPGPDGLRVGSCGTLRHICLSHSRQYLTPLLVKATSPVWKAAEVIPVPKPRSIQTDLRPISLLPCLAKIFESIVSEWILTTLEPQFDPNQFV